MWTMMVFAVATNLQMASQTFDTADACRGAAEAMVNPGVTYAKCWREPKRLDELTWVPGYSFVIGADAE